MEEQQKVADDLRGIVKLKISGFAVPDLIQVLKFINSITWSITLFVNYTIIIIESKITKEEQQKVADDLRAIVKLKISGFAVPDLIQV